MMLPQGPKQLTMVGFPTGSGALGKHEKLSLKVEKPWEE